MVGLAEVLLLTFNWARQYGWLVRCEKVLQICHCPNCSSPFNGVDKGPEDIVSVTVEVVIPRSNNPKEHVGRRNEGG